MSTQVAGNVYGAGTILGSWFVRRFMFQNSGLESHPYPGGTVLFVPFSEELFDAPTYYSAPPLQYELVERRGQVALWRFLSCFGYMIFPSDDGACASWNFVSYAYQDQSVPNFFAGFGCLPICGSLVAATPLIPANLMMLTVGVPRQPSELEDYGYEYAVAIAQAPDDATLADLWASVLQVHMPSTCAFGLATVTAIPSGDAYPVATSCREQSGSPL